MFQTLCFNIGVHYLDLRLRKANRSESLTQQSLKLTWAEGLIELFWLNFVCLSVCPSVDICFFFLHFQHHLPNHLTNINKICHRTPLGKIVKMDHLSNGDNLKYLKNEKYWKIFFSRIILAGKLKPIWKHPFRYCR